MLTENWLPLLGGAGLSSAAALLGTAWASGVAGLPPPLGLALSQRSVTAALGVSGAEALGASPALTVKSRGETAPTILAHKADRAARTRGGGRV